MERQRAAVLEKRFLFVISQGQRSPIRPLKRLPPEQRSFDAPAHGDAEEEGINLQRFCAPPSVREMLCTGETLRRVVCFTRTVPPFVLSQDVLRASSVVERAFLRGAAPPPSSSAPSFPWCPERRLCVLAAWLVLGGAAPEEQCPGDGRAHAGMLAARHGNFAVCALLTHMVSRECTGNRARAEAFLQARDNTGSSVMHYLARGGADHVFTWILSEFPWFRASPWDTENARAETPSLLLIESMQKLREHAAR